MTLAEAFTAEFEQEAKTTRKFLERFDAARADFRPHAKSFTAARLASHVVETPGWLSSIVDGDSFDFGAGDYRPAEWRTAEALVENHDRTAADFVEKLQGRSDEFLGETWRLLFKGKVAHETSRVGAIRGFILSHLIHHRAQLSVYYRLMDIPVPGAYGPSADDQEARQSAGNGS